MTNMTAALMFVLVLLGSGAVLAADSGNAAPEPSVPVILAASGDAGMPLGEILTLESRHLLTLGMGVVVGATVIGPVLGTSELIGVGLGLIAGEIVFRSDMWPLGKPRGWFN